MGLSLSKPYKVEKATLDHLNAMGLAQNCKILQQIFKKCHVYRVFLIHSIILRSK